MINVEKRKREVDNTLKLNKDKKKFKMKSSQSILYLEDNHIIKKYHYSNAFR